MTDKTPTCATCRYFVPYTSDIARNLGNCHRYPEGPEVPSSHWCGEHPDVKYPDRWLVSEPQPSEAPPSSVIHPPTPGAAGGATVYPLAPGEYVPFGGAVDVPPAAAERPTVPDLMQALADSVDAAKAARDRVAANDLGEAPTRRCRAIGCKAPGEPRIVGSITFDACDEHAALLARQLGREPAEPKPRPTGQKSKGRRR